MKGQFHMRIFLATVDCVKLMIFSLLQEVRRRGLKVSVVGVPKTIDNDIPVKPF